MRLLSVLTALVVSALPAAADPPRRVVSFNICTDQLVVALADPEQIAGLSPYATDPSSSVVAEQARRFRRLDWQAESTIALSPDLVLIGDTDRPITRRLLAAQGLRLFEITLVTDIAVARRQIAEVAAILGHPERGAKLVAEVDAARARLAAAARPPFRTVMVVSRGGYTAGTRSLPVTLLAEAGLQTPPGVPAGYGGFVSLERLLAIRPDAIVLNDLPSEANDQGTLYLTHPALRALYPAERRIILPTRYTLCGGPALVAALDYLAGLLARLAQSPTMRTN